MATTFASVDDLRIWVTDRIGKDATDDEIQEVVRKIHFDPKSPAFGRNSWEGYLGTLPENLIDLLNP